MADESDAALTGAAFELVNGGYAAMPDLDKKNDDDAIGSDGASLREAAEQRTGSHDEVTVRQYIDRTGEPVAANEAVTLDRAARDYARATAADFAVMENETSTALAARVDALRAEALAQNPDAAEFYGFEPLQAETDKIKPDDVESRKTASKLPEAGDPRTTGLDPEIEEMINHPQVRAAIEERIGEAEKTRQRYVNGIAAATQIAQVSFLSQFPELAGVAPENLPLALEQMSRQDPPKFARVQALVATTEALFAQQRQESHRQAETARQNFNAYAQAEDARLETMLKSEPKATQHAVMAEIFASANASGVAPGELIRLFNNEPLMRNAIFQRMMYDAGKYRLAMKARDAAVAKSVPPVQRPGSARTPGEHEHADIRTLSARLSNSGNIKDAVALYNARKSGRR